MGDTESEIEYDLEIFVDQANIDYRNEFDNLCTMVCWHKRYRLGDERPECAPNEYIFPEDLSNLERRSLYLYDHSGLTMSTSEFNSHWDSGWVGWIYVTHKDLRKEFGEDVDVREKGEEVIEGEVSMYDNILRGNIWGYCVHELCPCCSNRTEVVDSCFGFIGSYLEETGIKFNLPDRFTTEEIKEAWDKRLED